MPVDSDPPTPVLATAPPRPLSFRERWRSLDPGQRKRLGCLALFCAAVLAFFAPTLIDLARLALRKDLHSHVLLIPFVSGYLLWIRRSTLPLDFRPSLAPAILALVVGSTASAATTIWSFERSAHLAFSVGSFLLFLITGGFLFLGWAWMRAAAFPLAFLIFMVPLPNVVVDVLETASKLASTEAADLFFGMAGTTYLREGTTFQLPGITLEVAQECSGIRSSWVLFITGVFASNLLLRSTWRRWVLVLFVLPLGVLRNGFRILTLGLLCIHVGPHMIDTAIHHRGGPIFFALSLIPLLALIWWLRRGETRAEAKRDVST